MEKNSAAMTSSNPHPKRWIALAILCFGSLMIVLDSTIVNVALPSIKADLGFNDASLAWIVNAYLLTFGGFLLLSGRLGDIYGYRRLFIIGTVTFTIASLLCGLSGSQEVLIIARAAQGLAGAVVSATALSLLMNLFTDDSERTKAMGYFGFVSAGGGSVGVLLGGILTSSLNWHWIFLVNLPIGIIVALLSFWLLPHTQNETEHKHLDVAGAVTVTAALMMAVYAIVNGNIVGWVTVQTIGLLVGAAVVLALFILIESKVRVPLIPLSLFKQRNITVSNIVGVLWAAGMFAWFFLSALYLQLVLELSPRDIGLAFLPSNLIMAAFSLGLSARVVNRFGIRKPLAFGLGLATCGLLWFARAPIDGVVLIDVLPGMVLLGLGAGMAFNPVLLAAMGDVQPSESGLASGLVNTSFMMGGALGLAVLASIASAVTANLLAGGTSMVEALNSGYHIAFLVGGCFTGLAAILGGLLLRTR